MNIYIASDHGGFELKNKIITFLTEPSSDTLIKLTIIEGVHDIGPTELLPADDYTDYTFELTKKMKDDSQEAMGILVCRSGIGVCIAANKTKGIYAALCFTPEHAKKAREHNNANVLCLDADHNDSELHFEIIKAFLTTKFSGEERHMRRINEIKQFEDQNMK